MALVMDSATSTVNTEVMLPSKMLRWGAGDEPQDNVFNHLAAHDGELTPSMARSRSGSNLLSPPGLVAPPGTPSRGSTLHGSGKCRPCAWFWKSSGCQNGHDCGHCHLCPDSEIKDRKKNKLTMMRLGLATPTASSKASQELVGPLSFGLPLVTLADPYPPCSPWLYQDAVMAYALQTELESTAASGSEQGSLGVGSRADCLTASPSTEQESAANDSQPCSEPGDDQEQLPTGPPPGLKAPPNTPSHGSATHHMGNCRPCAWYWKPTGCQNGRDCKYCHSCSEGELRSRKKNKQVAMRLGLVTPKKDSTSEQDARYALSLAACI